MTVPRLDGDHHPITLIARDPTTAQRHAETVLAGAPEPDVRTVALRLLGMARRELGDPASAHRLLRQSAAVAARAGLADHAAQARASRLGLLALRGGGGTEAATLDRFAASVRSARAVVPLHRGVAAAQHGRFDTAVARFDTALARMLPGLDDRLLPGLLSNRGLALMYSNRLSESAEDLDRALSLAEDHALDHLRGVTLQNLGCLAVRHGDIARAISRFSDAAPLLPPTRRPALHLDHADALLAAGMVAEAERVLSEAGQAHRGRRHTAADTDRVIAALLRAKIHLGRGERDTARHQARRVRRQCVPDSMWARLADLVEWSALHVADSGTPRGHARPRPPAWAAGRVAAAASAVARCVPSAPLGPLPMAVPAARHGAALHALARGDHRLAQHELRRAPTSHGGPAANRHLELLAESHAHDREVAAAGAEVALREDHPATALEWIERGRLLTPARGPCRDIAWQRLLDRCRAEHARISAMGDDDPAALREMQRIAARLTLTQWHARCARPVAPTEGAEPVVGTLAQHLGPRAFVCYARVRGVPVALTLVDGRAAAHALGPLGRIEDAVAKLACAARMNAITPGPSAGHALDRAAATVGRLLLDPIATTVGDRPLVVSPPSYAQALPWGLLPGMRGREVCAVPSGRSWLDGTARGGLRQRRVLLAAGTGLTGATPEIRALSRLYPTATVLTGTAAATGTLLRELPRADLAHLSAHGSAPVDAPMLSGLLLADGPLFAYDLELLPRVPAVTVLSSCWVGRWFPSTAGLPLGLGASLLALGGSTVIAGVLPVHDHEIATAMVGLHTDLASGVGPARAVADHLAGAGFVCFGAG